MNLTRSTCHCGAVELKFKLCEPIENLRRCDCSICARKGAAVISALVEDVEVVKGADKLTLYTFNTHEAKHYFCSVCGIYTHHQRRSTPGEFGLNTGCIEGFDQSLAHTAKTYDGRNHPSDA